MLALFTTRTSATACWAASTWNIKSVVKLVAQVLELVYVMFYSSAVPGGAASA